MPTPETIYLVATICIFVFFALSFKNLYYGLIAYFGIMMLRIGLHYPLLAKLRIEMLVGLLVLVAIFTIRTRVFLKLKFQYNAVNKYLFLFFLVMLLSFVQAWDYQESWDIVVIEFIKIYFFFIMIMALLESKQQFRVFLWAFAVFTVILNYEGIYIYLTGGDTYVFQGVEVSISSKGFAAGHVAAANMQLQGLPIMFYLMLSEKKIILKLLAGILSLLSIFGIIASGSRGGFVGLIAFTALVVYYSQHKARAFTVAVFVVILSLPLLSGRYLSWMSSAVSVSDDSAVSRLTGLQNGFEMMMRRPLLGVGPGCYPLARKAWFGWGLESHNHYGQAMGDLGIPGTVIWAFFIYYVFKNLSLAKKKFYKAGVTDITLWIVGMQVALWVRLLEGMFSHSLYIFFWYMMAALSIIILKISENYVEGSIETEESNGLPQVELTPGTIDWN